MEHRPDLIDKKLEWQRLYGDLLVPIAKMPKNGKDLRIEYLKKRKLI